MFEYIQPGGNMRIAKRSKDLKMKRRVERPVSGKIAVIFLIPGILALIFSIYAEVQILALIGLGLTFWGVLFVFIRPVNFVESGLLYNGTVSAYLTIERIINEFDYKAKGYYIPPYPKDVYLPEYLKGLRDSIVFISAKKDNSMPSIEEMAKGKFISKNPKGALLTPPGSGFLIQIEEKSNVDFTKIELNELCTVLPSLILQDLNLAKEMAMDLDDDHVHLKIVDSLYKNLYKAEDSLKSVILLGCPIASAVACALAKASGRTVTIEKQQLSPDGSAIDVCYRIIKG
jgi:hypothetical protein